MSDSEHDSGMNGAVVRQLRAERAARGMKMEELAAASGIPARTLVRYLNGQRALTLNAVQKIAAGLGMETDTLILRAWNERREK